MCKLSNFSKCIVFLIPVFLFFQVRVLLIELEEARGNHIVLEEDVSSADISSTSEVISQHLVTFRSVEELQKQNQRLLVALRELSEAQEKEEFEATVSRCVQISFLFVPTKYMKLTKRETFKQMTYCI